MVSSYLQLIESRYSDDLNEDGEEFLEFAVDGAERMREMIDALLEYSRVDTQGDPFEPVDLDCLIEDVQEDLQMQIEENKRFFESSLWRIRALYSARFYQNEVDSRLYRDPPVD